MSMTVCTPRCGPNASSPLPGNNPPPAPGTGNGLPPGGEPGQALINTGPGEGDWQDLPPGALPEGGTVGQVLTNTGPGTGEWSDGVPGPEGPAGPEGLQGPAGPQGEEGPAGIQGVAGPDGPEGPQGPAGVEGPEGPQGPVGPAGPTGATGPQGAALNIDEYGILDEAKITAIETADVDWVFLVNPDGDDRANTALPAGIAGDMSRHLVIYRADTNAWQDYGFFTGMDGPEGPEGPQGPAGPAGPTGPQGLQGPAGPAGATGLQGPAGPTGAAGAAGAQGPAGATGATGATGAAGTTQPSYELVLMNDVAVTAGTYPLTISAAKAYTFTRLVHKTFQGTIANVQLLKNGAVAASVGVSDTTKEESVISVTVAVGDELSIVLTTPSGVNVFSATLR